MDADLDIVVISLPEAQARRERMRTGLQRYGLAFRYFDAIKPSEAAALGHPCYDRRKRLSRIGYDLRPGEIGCFLSHRAVWQQVVASGRPALVLEDDAQFLRDPGSALAAIRQRPDLAVVRLHQLSTREFIATGELVPGIQTVSYCTEGPSGTAAYTLTPQAAARLLALSERFHLPVDNFLDQEYRHHLHMVGLHPPLVATLEEPTTIPGRVKPRLSLGRKLLRELYKLPTYWASKRWSARKRRQLRG